MNDPAETFFVEDAALRPTTVPEGQRSYCLGEDDNRADSAWTQSAWRTALARTGQGMVRPLSYLGFQEASVLIMPKQWGGNRVCDLLWAIRKSQGKQELQFFNVLLYCYELNQQFLRCTFFAARDRVIYMARNCETYLKRNINAAP